MRTSLLEDIFSQHRTVQDILNWGSQQPPGSMHPHVIADVVVQDEYSHDVIVPFREGVVIVYGVT
jgi:hypothetical protein